MINQTGILRFFLCDKPHKGSELFSLKHEHSLTVTGVRDKPHWTQPHLPGPGIWLNLLGVEQRTV